MLVIIMALLKPNPSIVPLSWTQNVQVAIVVIGFVSFAVGAVGVASERGWLGAKREDKPTSPIGLPKGDTGDCTVKDLNGQAYYNVGRAWNDLHQYDEAARYFNCGASAIEGIKDKKDRDAWWETHAFILKDWGSALGGGEGKWCDAKVKFEGAIALLDPHKDTAADIKQAFDGAVTSLAKAKQNCGH